MTANAHQPRAGGGASNLKQQAEYFRAFGAMTVPGLFADEIGLITEGFDEMFRDVPSDAVDARFSLHRPIDAEQETPRRKIVGDFIERNEKLAWLQHDPRMTSLARALLGDRWRYEFSAGNIFNSFIYWHSDYFKAEIASETHIQFAFYLEALDAKSGALRVMPGTNHFGAYRSQLYDEPDAPGFGDFEKRFGRSQDSLPCWVLDSQPGDLVVFDNAALHANFNGRAGRRMFMLQFGQHPETQ